MRYRQMEMKQTPYKKNMYTRVMMSKQKDEHTQNVTGSQLWGNKIDLDKTTGPDLPSQLHGTDEA